jgi:two-component system, NarL family, response regulator DesR
MDATRLPRVRGDTRGTIDVVIVDDQPAVRDGLPGLLEDGQIVVRAAMAADPEAVEVVRLHRPAVALIGLGPRDRRGYELVRRLSGRTNGTAVLLHVRDTTTPAQIDRARRHGAAGAVSTRCPVEELREAIRAVAGGDKWYEAGEPAEGRSADLTERELDVLTELAGGNSVDQIAERLHLSPHTVRTHLRNGMRKLGAQTRAQAVAIAISEGAIETGASAATLPRAPS